MKRTNDRSCIVIKWIFAYGSELKYKKFENIFLRGGGDSYVHVYIIPNILFSLSRQLFLFPVLHYRSSLSSRPTKTCR